MAPNDDFTPYPYAREELDPVPRRYVDFDGDEFVDWTREFERLERAIAASGGYVPERPPADRSWLRTECGNCGRPFEAHRFGLCHPWLTVAELLALVACVVGFVALVNAIPA